MEKLESRRCLSAISYVRTNIEGIAEQSLLRDFVDIDQDGQRDLIATVHRSEGEVDLVWYRNKGGGAFGEPTVIDDTLTTTPLVVASDVSGDGDIDLVVVQPGKIAWYANLDGQGRFDQRRAIADLEGELEDFVVADIDGDGDGDILAATSQGITWFENQDFSNSIAAGHLVAQDHYEWVDISDFDFDGDIDIFVAGETGIRWFKNLDGRGTFDTNGVLIAEPAPGYELIQVAIADVDSDGDKDALSADRDGTGGVQIFLQENIFADGTFVPKVAVSDRMFGLELDLVADLDGDSDSDIVVYDSNTGDTFWYEADQTRFTGPNRIGSFGLRWLAAADMDNDGDIDLLPDSGLFWFDNRPTGDSNNDGVFNSSDLVKVLQAGQYEDDVEGNSTFDEGDWNGDGDFDSGDLVYALQTGNYVAAANPASVDSDSQLGGSLPEDRNETRVEPSPKRAVLESHGSSSNVRREAALNAAYLDRVYADLGPARGRAATAQELDAGLVALAANFERNEIFSVSLFHRHNE
jgi:hypothetical protein